MSELAFSINGETFDLPATAVGWRVRRMKQRGAPEVVYGKDGVPLVLPIEAGLEELRQLVGTPGRYRLDAIDDRGRTVEDLPASYVIVPTRELAQTASPHDRGPDSGATYVMAEAMRLNTELAKAVIERFPQMVEAAASLLRAADGAGLPARQPRVEEHDEEDDDDEVDDVEQKPGFDLNALVAQVVPMLVMSLGKGKLKMPDLASVLDWRKASPKAAIAGVTPSNQASAESPSTDDTQPESSVETELPPIDPTMMVHFIAIQSALQPDEAALARSVAADLPGPELRSWFDELSKLSVPEAVAKIRTMIGKGGAS